MANPIGLILSIAMMMELSFNRPDLSNKIKGAVHQVLEEGYRTQDIHTAGTTLVSTETMGTKIAANL
jgi:3-isopropylmalate dehydrogenase